MRGMSERERSYRDQMARAYDRMKTLNEKAQRGESLTAAEKRDFDAAETELNTAKSMVQGELHGAQIGQITADQARRAAGIRSLIGHDTHDLPEYRQEGEKRSGDCMLEARHDLKAYLSQRKDYNPTGLDMGSFDRDAFWHQLITRNTNGREFRALAEGAQSANVSGAGIIVPIAFSANVLELLRANLVFTSPDANGSLNGPMVVDMDRQVEYVPTWAADGADVTAFVAENTQMTPGTAQLGFAQLMAMTMANVSLASRQLIEDTNTNGGLADLIEYNLAAAMARGMDTAALYGTGHASGEPAGILTSAYSSQINNVVMGTNGAYPQYIGGSLTPVWAGARGQFGPFGLAIEKVRQANDEPTGIYTNPGVAHSFAEGQTTLNSYIDPPSSVELFWPPKVSTAFSNAETQGSSSAASSALVLNANRVILGMRHGLGFSVLDQRYADFLQVGFISYVRFDWAFPYAAASARVQGILTA